MTLNKEQLESLIPPELCVHLKDHRNVRRFLKKVVRQMENGTLIPQMPIDDEGYDAVWRGFPILAFVQRPDVDSGRSIIADSVHRIQSLSIQFTPSHAYQMIKGLIDEDITAALKLREQRNEYHKSTAPQTRSIAPLASNRGYRTTGSSADSATGWIQTPGHALSATPALATTNASSHIPTLTSTNGSNTNPVGSRVTSDPPAPHANENTEDDPWAQLKSQLLAEEEREGQLDQRELLVRKKIEAEIEQRELQLQKEIEAEKKWLGKEIASLKRKNDERERIIEKAEKRYKTSD